MQTSRVAAGRVSVACGRWVGWGCRALQPGRHISHLGLWRHCPYMRSPATHLTLQQPPMSPNLIEDGVSHRRGLHTHAFSRRGQMLRGCSAICASDRVQARPIRGHTSIAARSTKTHSGLGDCRLPESPPSGDRTGVKPPDGSRRQRRRMTAEPLLVPTRTIDGADGGPDSVRQPFRRRAAGADIQGGASARGENTHGCRIGESLSADTSTCYGPR